MALVAFSGSPQIIANGGPVFKNTFKAASNVSWARGTLLKLSTNGTVTPCLDPTGGAATLDTDDTGTSGARLFVALSNHGSLVSNQNAMINSVGTMEGELSTSSYPADDYVPVQEIYRYTVFEGNVATSAGDDGIAAVGDINATYAVYQLANGTWAVDIGNSTKAIVQIQDISPNYNPWATQSSEVYNKVRFVIISAILQK